jgi:hypothetical protein
MAGLLVWSVALLACSNNSARDAFPGRLEQAIASAAKAGGAVRMADVTDFEWDTLHVFVPYTSVEEVQKQLGFAWSEATELDLDTRNQLVFVKEGRVVKHLFFPRNKGDFVSVGKSRFTREDARFRAKDDAGFIRLLLDGA